MRILQVIGGGEKGGSRSHILKLCKGLEEAGHNVEIVCFLEDVIAASAREQGIPLTVFPMRNIIDFQAVNKLKGYIGRAKPDLVHTHGVRANFLGRLASRSLRVPVVTTVHSSVYSDYSNPLKKFFYHRIEKLTRKYTQRFIAVAGSLKRELEADGIDPGSIEVVYNGITPDFLEAPPEPSLKEELGISPETPVLITVGRLESVKNQEMLLKVFRRLKDQGISFHGVVVGDGPLMTRLQEKAAQLDIKEFVSFLGFRKDIFRLLSQSDIFLLTSKMEGLPVTLLEAMAAGIPAVVTEVGGMPEVIDLAGNGFTIPVDDVEQFAERVVLLLRDQGLGEVMVSRGRRALEEHFSHEKFIAGTLEVYRRLVQEVNP